MKRAVIGLLGSAVLVGALVTGGALLLRDDPLRPEVADWLRDARHEGADSAAFLYLMGMDAPADQAPEAYGRERLDAYQRWRARHSAVDEYSPPQLPTLDLPTDPLLCSIEQNGCWANQLAHPVELEAQVRSHILLAARYSELLALDDYQTLTTAGAAEPWPSMAYLDHAQRVFGAQVLLQARQGSGEEARERLAQELVVLRRLLARADQLLAKVMAGKLIDRNLELQARLYRQGWMPAPQQPAPLNEAERALVKPLQRELLYIATLFQSLPGGEGAPLKERIGMALLMRPNMSLNATFPPFRQVAELSRLEPKDFAREVKAQPRLLPKPTGWRNWMGDRLVGTAGPDYRAYAGRIQDLDAKLRLLALLDDLPAEPSGWAAALAASPVDNPYYPGQPARLEGGNRVCFAGPLEPKPNARCLPLR
ncbi:hypothetical protein QMA71_09565 [Pseudomonas otitidis]|uniref:hypothetical protein n=1 Tax=Metapseudomonas otitidis TaxID=319939 RepID=UPI0008E0B77C|nr:hypothetical protein [Pseudomonas otitidis]MDG9784029.1 hypothetical protein [Pseudomonas otitidis]MDI6525772.1 hypothetical protein [Pseudomonas otitidis]SFA57631.1 hypothetical protein SAMN05216263_10778 [Pseudomonas otitidis]